MVSMKKARQDKVGRFKVGWFKSSHWTVEHRGFP